MPVMRRREPSSRGLRLRVRALFSGSWSESRSSSSIVGEGLPRIDRVTGPKYPSFPVLDESLGVGEGDMTRGGLGIGALAMARCQQCSKDGREGERALPDSVE